MFASLFLIEIASALPRNDAFEDVNFVFDISDGV